MEYRIQRTKKDISQADNYSPTVIKKAAFLKTAKEAIKAPLDKRDSWFKPQYDTTAVGLSFVKDPDTPEGLRVLDIATKERRPRLFGRRSHREKAESLGGEGLIIGTPDKPVRLEDTAKSIIKLERKNKNIKYRPLRGERDEKIRTATLLRILS